MYKYIYVYIYVQSVHNIHVYICVHICTYMCTLIYVRMYVCKANVYSSILACIYSFTQHIVSSCTYTYMYMNR